MRKRVISTLLAMATTAGLFAGNVSAVYAEGKSSGDYEYQELEDAEITYYNYSVEGKELYEKEIAAYNEVHPNVKINLELVGGGTDWRSTIKRLKFQVVRHRILWLWKVHQILIHLAI